MKKKLAVPETDASKKKGRSELKGRKPLSDELVDFHADFLDRMDMARSTMASDVGGGPHLAAKQRVLEELFKALKPGKGKFTLMEGPTSGLFIQYEGKNDEGIHLVSVLSPDGKVLVERRECQVGKETEIVTTCGIVRFTVKEASDTTATISDVKIE